MIDIPSQDPADADSLAGTFRAIFRKLLQGIDGMLPARVLAYDRAANVATVLPLIHIVGTNGGGKARAQVAAVPVLALGGGGFVVNFPLKAGDLGWIEASDRDISLYLQSLDEAKPNTLRLHNFSDGRFIPDIYRKYAIAGEDDSDMVIQTLTGETKIVLRQDKIFIKAPNDITIEAAQTINLKAPQINIEGVLTMSGGAATIASSTLNITSDTTIEGRGFLEHQHTGVQTGGSSTGGVT
ncbi:MAG: hypothetical protein LBJ59_02700 [Zoogloeaceae bacterium]|jgi:hypothetical protein|nr:hypothetical protein [Zoogloeaceae bacterium]